MWVRVRVRVWVRVRVRVRVWCECWCRCECECGCERGCERGCKNDECLCSLLVYSSVVPNYMRTFIQHHVQHRQFLVDIDSQDQVFVVVVGVHGWWVCSFMERTVNGRARMARCMSHLLHSAALPTHSGPNISKIGNKDEDFCEQKSIPYL